MIDRKMSRAVSQEEATVPAATTIPGFDALDRGATPMTIDPKKPAVENEASVPLTVPTPPDSDDQWTNRRATEQAHRAASARQNSGRRRFVDPTTCERDYSGEEMEFMHAMQAYKKSSGRMFPTWSEVLEVLQSLGYEKSESATVRTSKSADPVAIGG